MPFPLALCARTGQAVRADRLLLVYAICRNERRAFSQMAVRSVFGQVFRRLRFVLLDDLPGDVALGVLDLDWHAAALCWEQAFVPARSLEEAGETVSAYHVLAAAESEGVARRVGLSADGADAQCRRARSIRSLVSRLPGGSLAFRHRRREGSVGVMPASWFGELRKDEQATGDIAMVCERSAESNALSDVETSHQVMSRPRRSLSVIKTIESIRYLILAGSCSVHLRDTQDCSEVDTATLGLAPPCF